MKTSSTVALVLLIALSVGPAGAQTAAPKKKAASQPEQKEPSESPNCVNTPLPSGLKSKIEAAQDRDSFLRIFNMSLGSRASKEWDCFLDKVQRGDEATMSALVVMSNKPYWLAAPDVTEALSQALKSKPAFSLRVIQASADPNRSAEVICRIDTPFGTTKESADEEAGKYFSALDNVTEESLNGTRVMCREWVSTHLNDWKNLR